MSIIGLVDRLGAQPHPRVLEFLPRDAPLAPFILGALWFRRAMRKLMRGRAPCCPQFPSSPFLYAGADAACSSQLMICSLRTSRDPHDPWISAHRRVREEMKAGVRASGVRLAPASAFSTANGMLKSTVRHR
ncbi:hypothetical protein B0T18DRAFT_411996 [Schizothecium vesticola]|uniref:Uncharacterized protein n=1 Tax=Schizothecium vesticola TaxID=314040 RepID=A0AA40EW08_9PEZI|nr:hypothetical protein B0T18DRAFT_411996 [Schizothecium vesticola]